VGVWVARITLSGGYPARRANAVETGAFETGTGADGRAENDSFEGDILSCNKVQEREDRLCQLEFRSRANTGTGVVGVWAARVILSGGSSTSSGLDNAGTGAV